MPNESQVPFKSAISGPQARELLVTTLINGVPTQVLMPVICISDTNGNLLDMNLAARLDTTNQLLADIRKELMLKNNFSIPQYAGYAVDVDNERTNTDLDSPY